MNVYKRYFRITSGPVMEKAAEIESANAQAHKAVSAFCKEVGAESFLYHSDGRWGGFHFSATPDQAVWKQPNSFGAYMPRKNTAAGREMQKRIDSLQRIVSLNNAIDAAGLQPGMPVFFMSDGRAYWPVLSGVPRLGVLVLLVPWSDIDPAKLAEYKRKREAGTEFSVEMDHLCWQPTADMQEVKHWEVEKEFEELNARLRAEQEGAKA